jgi:hypothetical protein
VRPETFPLQSHDSYLLARSQPALIQGLPVGYWFGRPDIVDEPVSPVPGLGCPVEEVLV